MSRFDYVKYDPKSMDQQEYAKGLVTMVESFIFAELEEGGVLAVANALKSLEETYMWIGKAIRNAQIKRNGSAPLQEERKDG